MVYIIDELIKYIMFQLTYRLMKNLRLQELLELLLVPR